MNKLEKYKKEIDEKNNAEGKVTLFKKSLLFIIT